MGFVGQSGISKIKNLLGILEREVFSYLESLVCNPVTFFPSEVSSLSEVTPCELKILKARRERKEKGCGFGN